MTLDDAHAVLAALEAGTLARPPPPPESEPLQPVEAVRRWVQAHPDWRPGPAESPTPPVLLAAFTAYARVQGWQLVEVSRYVLGVALSSLGFRRRHTASRTGWLVSRAMADALWLHAPPELPRERPRKPRRNRQPKPRRAGTGERLARAPWPPTGRARGVVDAAGRAYPSAAWAGALRRLHRNSIQDAARHGGQAGGTVWRYLTPAEVARLGPSYVPGTRVPWLAWKGAVAVHCAGCRCGVGTGEGVDGEVAAGGRVEGGGRGG